MCLIIRATHRDADQFSQRAEKFQLQGRVIHSRLHTSNVTPYPTESREIDRLRAIFRGVLVVLPTSPFEAHGFPVGRIREPCVIQPFGD